MVKLLDLLMRRRRPASDLQRLAEVSVLHFDPAVFVTAANLPGGEIQFEVVLYAMKTFDGVATVEALIDASGMRVSAVVSGREDQTDIYLGNYF